MISRERVKRAIHFQGVDHIPHFLPDGKENDLAWFWIPKEPDRQPWTVEADGFVRRIDAWGTTWTRPVGETNHGEKTDLAIPDMTRHAACAFPDHNHPRHFENARQAIAANNASGNPKYCLGVLPFSSLNEGVHNVTGLDRMFIAYYEQPDHLKALIGRFAEAQRQSIRRLAEIGCDGVMGYDDWGLQDRMMVGMDLIDEFFKPHYEANWKLAHELGMDVWLHSCGYILPLLPRLHAWGLDVIQQDQQENQGLENLDATVGGKLAFWCPVDIQQTMINGSLDDIRAYVRRMIATLGRHNGGLISMAYSTPETIHHTPEKVAAMCAAFREYGAMTAPTPLVWLSPSHDAAGSMPLGNGDIGLNVWVEEDGDLLFYLSKTDAWDENARLLKLGRIRVALAPNPFAAGATFRQELDLTRGCIRVQSEIGNHQSDILVWADANRPVVRVEIESAKPIEVQISVELWRTAERRREGAEGHCDAGLRSPDERETVHPDTVLDGGPEALLWGHRNRTSCWAATLEHQDMADWVNHGRDPLLNRTFGALLRGKGLVKAGDCTLRAAAPQTRVAFAIHPLTAQTETLEAWAAALKAQVAQSDATDTPAAFAAHIAWWQRFWQRSWIKISGTSEAETVSRGYELQRFVNACGGRGAFPIKFNGAIFTVDAREQNEAFDADYRRWGGGYWFQNTRLTYWPMIMSGDFDLMEPWFRMYRDALPFATARARTNFGLDDAAMFPETMTFWGTFLNRNYGYDRKGLAPGLSQNTYIRRYWQGMLELVAVLLDAYAVSRDETLLRDTLLALASPFLRFYRGYYTERDEDGKMRLTPSQSLETWHEAVNPAPDIAGLQWVLDGLLALPDGVLPADLRNEWQAFRAILPPLPTRHYVSEKRTEILPAIAYDQNANAENPELYAVFPYRLIGIGKPNLDIGLATWNVRRIKGTGGWRQDAIQAALLGITDDAMTAVAKNFATPHAGSRFPAFWGPNFDWIPDQDHGSAACIALQYMLMQWDRPGDGTAAYPATRERASGQGFASGGMIRLLPAWPKEWNVDFRLHAPGQTVVEGCVINGEIQNLSVKPEHRKRSVATDWPRRSEPAATTPATTLMTTGELPPLLVFATGSPVRSPEDWRCRRTEVADAILDLEYGGLPPTPEQTTVEELHTGTVPGIAGAAFRTCRIRTGPGADFSFLLTLLIPPGDGPFPVVLTGDACWRYASEAVVAEVLARGMMLAQFNRVELAPDIYTGDRLSGVYPLFPELRFGALSAWAWGYHRCVDALVSMPCADPGRIAVVGHSRGGKTVLLAGATDDRIALVGANNSGAGGAGCYRIQGRGSETLADLLRAIPYWFGPGLSDYTGRENDLPFDQHFLKALIAPRALLTTEAIGDAWANPIGTWHTHQAAAEVYRLLAVPDRAGIVFRPGGHQHGLDDWRTFLDFMAWQLCGQPRAACYNRNPFA